MNDTEKPTTEPRDLRYSSQLSWGEWVERWNAVEDYPTGEGLLQVIFRLRYDRQGRDTTERIKRLSFLLELAHRHDYEFEPNKELRQKAFRMLATHVFKRTSDQDFNLLWQEEIDKLLWFFLDEGRGEYDHQQNVFWTVPTDHGSRYGHAHEVASEYLKKFCAYFWVHNPQVRAQILEVLYNNESWRCRDVFLSILPRKCGGLTESSWRIFDDDELLAKFKEIAEREHGSVSMGVLMCSSAAHAYHLVSEGIREFRRRNEERRLKSELATISGQLEAVQTGS